MIWSKIASAIAIFASLTACRAVEFSVQVEQDVPSIRDLEWGELNFLQTSDTHGWLPGHLLEPQFSSNWGEYISFIHHMRKRADEKGVDLLVVDTGDRHDGNGLSDSTSPDGAISQLIFKQADLDIVIMGNHELYKPEIVQQEFEVLSTHYGDRFLTSNIDIWYNDEWRSVGQKYKLVTTKNQGLKVLTFGFLFNFNGANNSRVRHVEDVVQEQWFQDALQIESDIILLATHIPVRYSREMETLVAAVREVHPTKPIQILGGHSHIRDYKMYDVNAGALEPGRFLETIGWASVANIAGSDETSATFKRSYIDFNSNSLTKHSGTSLEIEEGDENYFHTILGHEVSEAIDMYRELLNLTEVYGCVPQSYFVDRVPYPSEFNLYSLIADKILPMIEGSGPRFVYTNTGSIRYDLVKGPFTKDTGFIVSPFVDSWYCFSKVPIDLARLILPLLNGGGPILAVVQSVESTSDDYPTHYDELDFSELGIPSGRGRPRFELPDDNDSAFKPPVHQHYLAGLSATGGGLSGGYVTHDDLGSDGDDTPHEAWAHYEIPNAIAKEDKVDDSTEFVDVVFTDFMLPFMVRVMKELNASKLANAKHYSDQSTVDLLKEYFKSSDTQCS